ILWLPRSRPVSGLLVLADSVGRELQRLLPTQRKTQRVNLALLVATMLDVRSANLMDLAAGLPRPVERIDMRFQWIWPVVMNPLIKPDDVIAPFATERMALMADQGEPLVLILDQTKINQRHQMLMLALRIGRRALPVAWRIVATQGAIGFEVQKDLLAASPRLAAARGQGLPDGRSVLRHGQPDCLVPGPRLGRPANWPRTRSSRSRRSI
ncbi:hypothetical protein ACQVP2_25790, partial [Methylobacterium aquaticum]